MTPSELKYHHEQAKPDGTFFCRGNMKFFGDTMKNYGVRAKVISTRRNPETKVWELYRKRPVKRGMQTSAYFDVSDFSVRFEG